MQDDLETLEAARAPRRSRLAWLGWLLFLFGAAGVWAFVKDWYLPLRTDRARLEHQVADGAAREAVLEKRVADAAASAAALATRQQELSGELAHTEAEKAELESELKHAQSELSSILEPEIHAGSVQIKRRGNELVVGVSDQVLFDSGSADVSAEGQKVLQQVAPSLARLKAYAIEVGGHTDRSRIVNRETAERFPTNWELSTARATNVVRFLEEHGKIPGARLVAAGYAQYRPVASNATEAERQKNRRIELELVPIPKSESPPKAE